MDRGTEQCVVLVQRVRPIVASVHEDTIAVVAAYDSHRMAATLEGIGAMPRFEPCPCTRAVTKRAEHPRIGNDTGRAHAEPTILTTDHDEFGVRAAPSCGCMCVAHVRACVVCVRCVRASLRMSLCTCASFYLACMLMLEACTAHPGGTHRYTDVHKTNTHTYQSRLYVRYVHGATARRDPCSLSVEVVSHQPIATWRDHRLSSLGTTTRRSPLQTSNHLVCRHL